MKLEPLPEDLVNLADFEVHAEARMAWRMRCGSCAMNSRSRWRCGCKTLADAGPHLLWPAHK